MTTTLSAKSYDFGIKNAKSQFAISALAIAMAKEALRRAKSGLRELSTQLTKKQCKQALETNEVFPSRSKAVERAEELSILYPGFPFTYYSRFAASKSRVSLYEKPISMWCTRSEEGAHEVFLNGCEVALVDGGIDDLDDLDDLHPQYLGMLAANADEREQVTA